MATIKDVAGYTGLSVATISKFLNGGTVKERNRALIVKAIEELDYQVNPFARSLKTRKSYTVGVLLPSVTAPFFGNILTAMDICFREKGYNLVISSYESDPHLERWKLESFVNNGIDGLVYMPENMDKKSYNELLGSRNMPVVLVDRLIPDVNVDAVVVNNSTAVYSAAEVLIEKGHRRIGFIVGPLNVFTAQERCTGLERVCSDYGIEIDPQLRKTGAYTVSEGYRMFNELMNMQDPPTAVISTNHDLTIGAITAANERGIALPQDVEFFGYDCTEVCRLMNPPLCTVEQPEHEIGTTAAQYLLDRLEGNQEPPRLTRLKAQLNLH